MTYIVLRQRSHYTDSLSTSNSLQDIRKIQWNYMSQWPTNILRRDVKSYWLIIPKYYVHPQNSFQDIRQDHWTMKYKLQWPTVILRSNVMSKYDVHTSHSLQDNSDNSPKSTGLAFLEVLKKMCHNILTSSFNNYCKFTWELLVFVVVSQRLEHKTLSKGRI